MHVDAVEGLPEVRAGADLASLIEAHAELGDEDVLCVASTIVSKAEDRLADLSEFPAGPRAREIATRLGDLSGEEKDPRFAQAVLEESTEIIMEAPFLLTETRFGHVGVNAGIDRSNVKHADLALLPERPSESARRIREGLEAAPAVIVTDTCGRPFRHGQVGVAIGWAGMAASRDWRGESDRGDHTLRATVQSVVDELAGTANLLMGEGAGGTPAVVVREWSFGEHGGSENLYRDVSGDFVRQALREWSYAPD